jgi:HSP90 family molecular chaperone
MLPKVACLRAAPLRTYSTSSVGDKSKSGEAAQPQSEGISQKDHEYLDELRKTMGKVSAAKAGASKAAESKPADAVEPPTNGAVEKPAFKIEENEKVSGASQKLEFQAETRKLLDIVARSLYTDREVFVRELVSNASDALEKLRHMQSSGQEISDSYLPLEIQMYADPVNRTLTIQDFGVGMTKEELILNLGTIAHSGSLKFLNDLEKGGKGSPSASNIIGQFGVGFYSTFMVADKVKVYTRSAIPGSKGYGWVSDGHGSYELAEAEGVARGTKIIMHLKDDAKEFSQDLTVSSILKKYSNFVNFDIKLNGRKTNTVKALWLMNKKDISEQEHKEFYQFIGNSYDVPTYTIHYHTDSPINIRGLLYVPEQHMEKYGAGRMEPGVNLFSRRVLIQAKTKLLLPDWLRFMKGAVDSEDIPLNLSREHLQDSALIKRVSNVITSKVLKTLEEELKNDRVKFEGFFREFGPFLKEGVLTDIRWKEELAKLLLYESSGLSSGRFTTLQEYISRMKPDQKEIYYLVTTSRQSAEHSPYYEAFKRKGYEVLFLYTNFDDFVMTNLNDVGGKSLKTIESAQIDLPKDEENADTKLDKPELQGLLKWMKESLSAKVVNVKETNRLSNAPAIIVDHESAALRKMMRMVDPTRAPQLPKQLLEINPSHPLILGLSKARTERPALAQKVAEQIYDNALIAAGLMEESNSVSMLQRLNAIMEDAIGAPKREASASKVEAKKDAKPEAKKDAKPEVKKEAKEDEAKKAFEKEQPAAEGVVLNNRKK